MKFNKKDILFEFIIKGTLDGANEYLGAARSGFFLSNEMKQNNEAIIREAIQRSKIPKVSDGSYPINLFIEWNEPKKKNPRHNRDYDNIIFGSKFILDSLTKEKIIYDDNLIDYIRHIQHDVKITEDKPYIKVIAIPDTKCEFIKTKKDKNNLKFTIPGRLIDTNKYINLSRGHWSKASKQKKATQGEIKYAIWDDLGMGKKVNKYPLTIHINWYEGKITSRSKYRDFDNITFAVKFILDALIESGIIIDDSTQHIEKIINRVSIDDENPRIEVTLIEPGGRKENNIKKPY